MSSEKRTPVKIRVGKSAPGGGSLPAGAPAPSGTPVPAGLIRSKESGSKTHQIPPEESPTLAELEQIEQRPHRNAFLHWAAFLFSLLALVPICLWLINPQSALSGIWYWTDIGLSGFFVFEFVTRSGFRWHPASYTRSRFFDFIAIVPALVLARYNVVWATAWVYLILVMRVVRVLDRILGDGFIRRNALALLEGFEEEITDRVMMRIINRVEEDLSRGRFGRALADSLTRNKEPLLQRIRSENPQSGLVGGLARISGLDTILERAEERTFDSVVSILGSAEVDQAIHESLDSTFAVLKTQIGQKTWRQHLGIKFSLWR